MVMKFSKSEVVPLTTMLTVYAPGWLKIATYGLAIDCKVDPDGVVMAH
jgi:hypothetical protein